MPGGVRAVSLGIWSNLLNDQDFDHTHPEVPKGCHPETPEDMQRLRESSWWAGGYLAPILVVLFTIFWSLAAYWLIGWRSSDWQFGTLPYIPSQSAFTTRPVPPNLPKQVTLPEPTPAPKPAHVRGGRNATH